MSMFYCIVCRDLHPRQDAEKIFKTGFHTLPGGQNFPLGCCDQDLIARPVKTTAVKTA